MEGRARRARRAERIRVGVTALGWRVGGRSNAEACLGKGPNADPSWSKSGSDKNLDGQFPGDNLHCVPRADSTLAWMVGPMDVGPHLPLFYLRTSNIEILN